MMRSLFVSPTVGFVILSWGEEGIESAMARQRLSCTEIVKAGQNLWFSWNTLPARIDLSSAGLKIDFALSQLSLEREDVICFRWKYWFGIRAGMQCVHRNTRLHPFILIWTPDQKAFARMVEECGFELAK